MKNIFKTFTLDENDIINLILDDHEILKDYIKVLKDKDKSYDEKHTAFNEFSVLLMKHSKPEEQTWYVEMEKYKKLRPDALEGEVEHALCEQLISELKQTNDRDLWMAKVKVLAELVEHHVIEEEDDHLSEFKDNTTEDFRIKLGEKFLSLKQKMNQFNTSHLGRNQDYHSSSFH